FEGEELVMIINNNNFKTFEDFMSLYQDSVIIRPFFNFRWRNMSSGERAFFNIFSRFYSIVDGEELLDNLKENLLIIIDEGDLYLHPEWQKRFLKELLDFLPIIFINKIGRQRNLQLIFTTNSPIPASDLLSYNTIFLEKGVDSKGEEITVVKDSLNEQKDTFGANIHTLLSDSFFVHDG
ncbi:AAA family ATPase, partial [Burkholderia sp. SIMBA_045]